MRKKVGIIFGGDSVEHEISIITALQAIENIDDTIYEVVPIYLSKDQKFYSHSDFFNIEIFKTLNNISKKYKEKVFFKEGTQVYLMNQKGFFGKSRIEIDLFFPIVHGTHVEDGKLQGFLDMFGIPYIGPTTTSGVLGQEKSIMKDILTTHNIRQTKYIWLEEKDSAKVANLVEEGNLSYPVIVKPNCLGSSIGIFVATSSEELSNNIDDVFKYDQVAVIEEMLVDFEELNVSLINLDDKIYVSEIEKVCATEDVLTYEDKYLSSNKAKNIPSKGMASLSRELPAHVELDVKKEIINMTTKSYEKLRCQGLVRIDLLLYKGEIYINEVNNIPGSLSYYLWEEKGITYKDLLTQYIEDGIKKYYKRKNKSFTFTTNVLNLSNGKFNK